MTEVTLSLHLDTSAVLDALARIAALLPDAPRGTQEAFDRLIGEVEGGASLVRIEGDALTADAGEAVLRLQPSERLLGFLSTLGAGDGE